LVDRKVERAAKFFESICYDFSTGDLKDTHFIREKAKFVWRRVGAPIDSIKGAVLRLEVNMKDGRLAFYCNNQWACETVIPNFMMKAELVPFISVKHKGD
jgi:hypothetical protein